MTTVRDWLSALVLALAASGSHGVESDPLPAPDAGARANAVRVYNDGVALLVARKFPEAQSRFEAALMLDDQLAEAHNNLAYALRMQGRQNFAASLAHYDRAMAYGIVLLLLVALVVGLLTWAQQSDGRR